MIRHLTPDAFLVLRNAALLVKQFLLPAKFPLWKNPINIPAFCELAAASKPNGLHIGARCNQPLVSRLSAAIQG